ncbi:hypothetical protein [Desulfosporosinus burensis]
MCSAGHDTDVALVETLTRVSPCLFHLGFKALVWHDERMAEQV